MLKKLLLTAALAMVVGAYLNSRSHVQTPVPDATPAPQSATADSVARGPASRRDTQAAEAGNALFTLRQSMRNPDTFKVSSIVATKSGAECIEYRAQNGFGGLNVEHAVVRNGRVIAGSAAEQPWESYCSGKPGFDITADVRFALHSLGENPGF